MQHPSPPPWYKQLAPWLLISIPALAVVLSSIGAWLAVSRPDPVTDNDYYNTETHLNQQLAQDRQAAQHKLRGSLLLNAASGVAHLQVHEADTAALPPVLRLQLHHPTLPAQDRSSELKLSPQGDYVGEFAPSNAQRWQVDIAVGPSWHLYGDWDAKASGPLAVTPGQQLISADQ
ncbi:hypothetical protein SAMN02745857_03030 [Andreprevotia lacus DSM 23236]|jgi:hypothetical protein|uniref:Nitrogen fixation protein FixH n=1 Tax=Andreprevotia lacus DSM 23236 TaxID=1121001 RepID=A0A1W1XVB6_9NEIS|nr:FixH family protein [Andreprevotia lacus]SMC27920.1 hypothetical protein SAMN02745857_03030 [Andreprevotia lacus DSM 23236]